MRPHLLVSTIAATLMIGAVLGIAIVPQPARAEILMPITYDEGLQSLDVPDAETTVSAYGGRLRLYDVHIAKMVEVTHDRCSRSRSAGGSPEENGSLIESHSWIYTANRANMGNFTITCTLAQNLANIYGLGEPESTTIRFEVSSAVMGSRIEMIPILDITGEEIDEWMNFTRNFKPWQSKEHR